MDANVARKVNPAVILVPLLATSLVIAGVVTETAGPFRVVVDGEARVALPGMTVAGVLASAGLAPRSGDLVDVEGEVLRRGAYPGKVLLNGEQADLTEPVEIGDRIQLVHGRDHREGLIRDVIPVPAGQPGNPQFFLATTPGEQIVTSGAISGKLVSTVFVPKGPAEIEPAVALTFDDGPSPTWTPRILEVLERHHVPATFFVVGYLADRHPRLIDREVAAGMAVATHSWGHPLSPPFEKLPLGRMRSEIARGVAGLVEHGIAVGLFRPPFGSYSDRVIRVARRAGVRLVLWNVDPGDWRDGITRKQLVRNVLEAVGPGSIVLLHDGGGDRSATVAALPAIIRGIRAMGLELVTIGADAP